MMAAGGADDAIVREAMMGATRELPRAAINRAPRIRFPVRERPGGPEFSGRHLWVTCPTFVVDNPAEQGNLLHNHNLLRIEGPGCWWCGTPWSPTVGSKCPGPADREEVGIVVHIAGIDVEVDSSLRQLCAWCGFVLVDWDLDRIAVPEGQTARPGTWPIGTLVAVDGICKYVVAHEDGLPLPDDVCTRRKGSQP